MSYGDTERCPGSQINIKDLRSYASLIYGYGKMPYSAFLDSDGNLRSKTEVCDKYMLRVSDMKSTTLDRLFKYFNAVIAQSVASVSFGAFVGVGGWLGLEDTRGNKKVRSAKEFMYWILGYDREVNITKKKEKEAEELLTKLQGKDALTVSVAKTEDGKKQGFKMNDETAEMFMSKYPEDVKVLGRTKEGNLVLELNADKTLEAFEAKVKAFEGEFAKNKQTASENVKKAQAERSQNITDFHEKQRDGLLGLSKADALMLGIPLIGGLLAGIVTYMVLTRPTASQRLLEHYKTLEKKAFKDQVIFAQETIFRHLCRNDDIYNFRKSVIDAAKKEKKQPAHAHFFDVHGVARKQPQICAMLRRLPLLPL